MVASNVPQQHMISHKPAMDSAGNRLRNMAMRLKGGGK